LNEGCDFEEPDEGNPHVRFCEGRQPGILRRGDNRPQWRETVTAGLRLKVSTRQDRRRRLPGRSLFYMDEQDVQDELHRAKKVNEGAVVVDFSRRKV